MGQGDQDWSLLPSRSTRIEKTLFFGGLGLAVAVGSTPVFVATTTIVTLSRTLRDLGAWFRGEDLDKPMWDRNIQLLKRTSSGVTFKAWVVGDKEVRLVRNGDRLTCLCIELSTGNLLREALLSVEGRSAEEVLAKLETGRPIIGSDHSIVFERASVEDPNFRTTSQLNPSLVIDHVRWAITLVSAGSEWYGHAMIVIEGVEANQKVIKVADLVSGVSCGIGKAWCWASVRVRESISADSLKKLVKEKTETWITTKENVYRMLRRIYGDRDGSEYLFFQPTGKDSVANGHLFIGEIKGEYPTYRIGDTIFNNVVSQDTTEITNKLRRRAEIDPRLSSSQVSVSYREKIDNVKEAWIEERLPDNCITWALRMRTIACGDELDKAKYSALFSVPLQYTQPVEGHRRSSCVIS